VIDPTTIFLRAQQAWVERVVPPYESFQISCNETFLAARCKPGDVVAFTLRMSDGRAFAQLLSPDSSAPVVVARGAFITGPAGTPLGFYRMFPAGSPAPTPPPNFVADPLQTIATVSTGSHAYDVTLAGEDEIAGVRRYHLVLHPLRDASRYPLLRDSDAPAPMM